MAEPVTLAEAKAQLRLDTTDFDDYIEDFLIPAAREWCENYLNSTIVASTERTETLDAFPAWEIDLPDGPVTSVTTISYVDTDGNNQTFTDFILSKDRITPSYGNEWPATRDQIGAVTITYEAGRSTVPVSIKQAILILITDLFEFRTVTMEMQRYENPAAERLLYPYRINMGV